MQLRPILFLLILASLSGLVYASVTITSPSVDNNWYSTNIPIEYTYTGTASSCSYTLDGGSSVSLGPSISQEAETSYSGSGWVNIGNVVDEDWGTYGSGGSSGSNIDIYYDKPAGTTSANWTVKDGENTQTVEVPAGCFDETQLHFRVNSKCNAPIGQTYNVTWYCYDSGSYVPLRSVGTNSFSSWCRVYEESVLFMSSSCWNITGVTWSEGTRTVVVSVNAGGVSTATRIFKIDKTNPSLSSPAIYSGTTYGSYFKGTVSLRSSVSDSGLELIPLLVRGILMVVVM